MKIKTTHSAPIISQAKQKIKSIDVLATLVKGNCIFTKGVFDLLHYGHLSLFSYLASLKAEYNYPIVAGVSSDAVVKEKKGSKRPINPQDERALQIALLPQVDHVFINSSADLSSVITQLSPKFYIKGVDTAGADIDEELLFKKNPEFALMEEGSAIIIFSDDQSISTSDILKRITKSSSK